jgi:hypothetical protein
VFGAYSLLDVYSSEAFAICLSTLKSWRNFDSDVNDILIKAGLVALFPERGILIHVYVHRYRYDTWYEYAGAMKYNKYLIP